MGQMIEGIVYIRFILKKIAWKKKRGHNHEKQIHTYCFICFNKCCVVKVLNNNNVFFLLLLCIKFPPRFGDNEVHLNCLSPWN